MNDLVEQYRYGHCYAFALATAEALGWQIGALVVSMPRGAGNHIVHSYLVDPDGRMIDAGGEITAGGMVADYLSDSRRYTSFSFEVFSDAAAFKFLMRELYLGDWSRYEGLLKAETEKALEVLERLPYFLELRDAPALSL